MAQFTVDLAKIFKRTTTSLLIICFWVLWATRAQAASDVLFYNPANGSATIGRVEGDGQFSSSFHFPSGSFAANWSHIVRTSNGFLFFYRQTDGLFAVGRFDANVGFVTLQAGHLAIYDSRAGYLIPNFNVVSTPNGILICRGGTWHETQEGGLIGQVRNNGLFQVTQYLKIGGWTNVVNTPNGLFLLRSHSGLILSQFAVGRILSNGIFSQTHSGFINVGMGNNVVAIGNDLVLLAYARDPLGLSLYPQISGEYRVGGVDSNGILELRNRTWCASSLAGGNVIPVALGNSLLLYAVWDAWNPSPTSYPQPFTRSVLGGWAQINTFQPPSDLIPYDCWGQLETKSEFPEGFFSRGWSKIVHTVNGTLMHNPDDGATVVGSFNADGTFSQLSYNLVDTGYTMLIKMTEYSAKEGFPPSGPGSLPTSRR
jgi:hypothetical protein